MPTKLGRKQVPSGYGPDDFKYMGRPAKDQDDFGPDVGLADCACVNQFGESNNAKYYHGGVVQASDGTWWVYLEWGRMKGAGTSWNGNFRGGDFQFVQCSGEDEARVFFQKQLRSKNIKRLVRKDIGGTTVWAGKAGKDGYMVQALATRERGLPDAYKIKDSSGIQTSTSKPKTSNLAKPSKNFHPKVVDLAQALVGGTQTYTRSLSQATGVVPTMDAIGQVRDSLIPAALKIISQVGNDIQAQVAHTGLRDLSRMVYSMVPRHIPRTGLSDEEAILSSSNILALQNDLDAFESALQNEDFSVDSVGTCQVDPDKLLNATLTWIDPNSDHGRWLSRTFLGMSNRRHAYLSQDPRIINMFAVDRPDRDDAFRASVQRVAGKRRGRFSLRANLQPMRVDLSSDGDTYSLANVIFVQHGTRSVNVAPIMQTHFRLPKQLKGVRIVGANFGHGTYASTDFRKAVGYTSSPRAYWSAGGGGVKGRGAFMFLCDMIMGDAYRAPSTGSWIQPPNGKDSVFGVGGDRGHRLQNDEHVVFDPTYLRIRYLMELTF